MSRYQKNIEVLERLKCNKRESGMVSHNEAILCAEIDTLAAEVRRLREEIKKAEELHAEVKRLCALICNTVPVRSVGDQGRIDSIAFCLGHHPLVLGAQEEDTQ